MQDQRSTRLAQTSARSLRLAVRATLVVATGLLVANCGSGPKKAGIDPKYGVRPSPRVVAEGERVPRGGGVDKTGAPYVVAGRVHVPREEPGYSAVGMASWYGASFHGRRTANGEVFDRSSISVAHPTMPLPSYVRLTNTLNGRSMIARVNDRGPFHAGRLVDVSERVAHALNFRHLGVARVRVDYLGRASLEGSDDAALLATLRTDGTPAQLGGVAPVMIASTSPVAPLPTVPGRPAQSEREDASAEAASLLSGTPMPGMPMPPDRPFSVGSYAPLSARPVAASPVAPVAFMSPAPAVAPAASVPAAAAVVAPSAPAAVFVQGAAGVPLPPLRPNDGFRAASLSPNAAHPPATGFLAPPRGRVGL